MLETLSLRRSAVLVLALSAGGFRPAAAADALTVLRSHLLGADAIALGRTLSVRPEEVEGTPMSVVRFAVERRLKGEIRDEVEILVERAAIQRGKVLFETGVPDAPRFGTGEEAVVFLSRVPETENRYVVTEQEAGKIRVSANEKGERRAERYFLAPLKAGGVPLDELLAQLARELATPAPKP